MNKETIILQMSPREQYGERYFIYHDRKHCETINVGNFPLAGFRAYVRVLQILRMYKVITDKAIEANMHNLPPTFKELFNRDYPNNTVTWIVINDHAPESMGDMTKYKPMINHLSYQFLHSQQKAKEVNRAKILLERQLKQLAHITTKDLF